jgi:hypothetical protein
MIMTCSNSELSSCKMDGTEERERERERVRGGRKRQRGEKVGKHETECEQKKGGEMEMREGNDQFDLDRAFKIMANGVFVWIVSG